MKKLNNVIYAIVDKVMVEVPEDKPSIFLAGPTPRDSRIPSWRPLALHTLSRMDFDGYVFVPEGRNGVMSLDYEKQIEWEEHYLRECNCIMFWIPRDLTYLPGFTTNIEFGRWCDTNKIVVGWLPGTPKMKYIEYYTRRLNIPTADTLNDTVKLAVEMSKKHAEHRKRVNNSVEEVEEWFKEELCECESNDLFKPKMTINLKPQEECSCGENEGCCKCSSNIETIGSNQTKCDVCGKVYYDKAGGFGCPFCWVSVL